MVVFILVLLVSHLATKYSTKHTSHHKKTNNKILDNSKTDPLHQATWLNINGTALYECITLKRQNQADVSPKNISNSV